MPLVTTKRTGLVDQVIEQMRELVTSGEWPLGERIPPESALVTALGVGRNTLREAVRALAHAGLLEVRQGDGTFVRATSELSGAVRRLCEAELREVLEIRRALEVESARLAATARTSDDIAGLETALEERDKAFEHGNRGKAASLDTEFHLKLVEAAHNPVLAGLYRGIAEAVWSSVASAFDSSLARTPQVSHHALLDAVRDGDAQRAAAEAGELLDELLAQVGEAADGI